MTTNKHKADITAKTLLVHGQYRSLGEDEEVVIPDLLTGIMHFLDDYPLDFDKAVAIARSNYEADKDA